MSGKVEDMHPSYKTVLQALRYGLEILEDPDISDKDKVSRAKHQIKDTMHILGYTEDQMRNFKR